MSNQISLRDERKKISFRNNFFLDFSNKFSIEDDFKIFLRSTKILFIIKLKNENENENNIL